MSNLARELFAWRRTFNLTQQEAGELLGISRESFIRLERKGYEPSATKLRVYELVVRAMYAGAEMQKDWGPL